MELSQPGYAESGTRREHRERRPKGRPGGATPRPTIPTARSRTDRGSVRSPRPRMTTSKVALRWVRSSVVPLIAELLDKPGPGESSNGGSDPGHGRVRSPGSRVHRALPSKRDDQSARLLDREDCPGVRHSIRSSPCRLSRRPSGKGGRRGFAVDLHNRPGAPPRTAPLGHAQLILRPPGSEPLLALSRRPGGLSDGVRDVRQRPRRRGQSARPFCGRCNLAKGSTRY
jgi:hypothetical protein